MRLITRIQSLVRNLSNRQQLERQIDDEVRAYLELLIDEKMATGMSGAEARRVALVELGGVEQVKQAVRDERAGIGLEVLAQDVRYGLRQLRHNRSFTLTAVITLGLAIGATTAIFSAVYSLLLRPLPYRDSSRLAWVSNEWPKLHMEQIMSPNFVAAREETKSFEQLAAYTSADGNLTGAGYPVRITHANITADFLPMLGVEAQLGRIFSGTEDTSGGPKVVVISDRLWRDRFNANHHILGSEILLDGVQHTVIGILPAHFRFPDVQLEPDVYSPLGLDPAASVSDERVFLLSVIGRLRVGVSSQQAQAELLTFLLGRTKTYPAGFAHMAQGQRVKVEMLQRHIVGDNRKPLLMLFASVGFVLLIACANVANLQLARGVSRQHETAVRGALGASRLRIMQQLFVESMLLSGISAALGLLIGIAVTYLIRHLQMPDMAEATAHSWAAEVLRLPFGKLGAVIDLDGWVFAFIIGVAGLTTVLCGVAPAIGATLADPRSALHSAALRVTSGREQRLLLHSLLLAELGLAVVLLASAGLMVRSFITVLHFDSGFDPRNTLTGVTLLDPSRYSTRERMQTFVERLLPALSAKPGVMAVAVSSSLPIQPYDLSSAVTFEGTSVPPPGMRQAVSVVSITPEYFRAVGTPIFQGRAFLNSDSAGSAPVTIVNRAFANRFFAGEALGKQFHSMAWGSKHPAVTIVGVADDVRHGARTFTQVERSAIIWVPIRVVVYRF